MTSTPTRPVDNVVIATKGLQHRNINILAGTTVENKGKLILIENDSLSHEHREEIQIFFLKCKDLQTSIIIIIIIIIIITHQ